MRTLRMMLLSAVLAGGMTTVASAQYNGGTYRGGVMMAQNNGAYQQGWRDAQDDARHGRQTSRRVDRYHNDVDRQAYDQGYAQGYQAYVRGNNGAYNGGYYGNNGQVGSYGRERHRDRDCDADDPCGQNGYGGVNGAYGNYGGANGAQVAQQYGFNDGLREGQADRASGHSYRPTSDTGYRLATNGYQGQFGSRDQYKQWYRSAYQQGYQQGYNGGNANTYGRRWPWQR